MFPPSSLHLDDSALANLQNDFHDSSGFHKDSSDSLNGFPQEFRDSSDSSNLPYLQSEENSMYSSPPKDSKMEDSFKSEDQNLSTESWYIKINIPNISISTSLIRDRSWVELDFHAFNLRFIQRF